MASSAQCKSSSTSTVGDTSATSLESADNTSCCRPPRSTRSSSSPPVACATSTNGPSARGVNSASQPPQRIRVAGRCCSQNRRTTAVLPTPASPRSSTSRPCPSLSTLAAKSPNTRRCSDRSNNSSDVTDVLIADFSTVSTPRTQTPILQPRVSTRNPDTQTPRHRANRSSRWAPISASTATNAESCNLPCRVLRQPGRILTGVTTRREENELLERPSRAQGGVSGGAGILGQKVTGNRRSRCSASKRPRHHQRELFSPECVAV